MKAISQYIKNLFVVLDQTANTVAAGKPDCTVSACAYAYHTTDKFWFYMMVIIDFAFFPIHGEGHCKQAFMRDNETYNKGGIFRKSLITLFSVPFCFILSLFVWTYHDISKLIKYIVRKF